MREAHDRVEVAIAVDIREAISIRPAETLLEHGGLEARPGVAVVSQPIPALEDVEVAVAIDVAVGEPFSLRLLMEHSDRPRIRPRIVRNRQNLESRLAVLTALPGHDDAQGV